MCGSKIDVSDVDDGGWTVFVDEWKRQRCAKEVEIFVAEFDLYGHWEHRGKSVPGALMKMGARGFCHETELGLRLRLQVSSNKKHPSSELNYSGKLEGKITRLFSWAIYISHQTNVVRTQRSRKRSKTHDTRPPRYKQQPSNFA